MAGKSWGCQCALAQSSARLCSCSSIVVDVVGRGRISKLDRKSSPTSHINLSSSWVWLCTAIMGCHGQTSRNRWSRNCSPSIGTTTMNSLNEKPCFEQSAGYKKGNVSKAQSMWWATNSPSAGRGVAHFHWMSRGPERKSLHTEQRGKENMASQKCDDGEMPIPARESKGIEENNKTGFLISNAQLWKFTHSHSPIS